LLKYKTTDIRMVNPFDYTEWRKSLVDSIDTMDKLDEFVELSKEKIQFNGNPKSVI